VPPALWILCSCTATWTSPIPAAPPWRCLLKERAGVHGLVGDYGRR
jgi:hypothetical protein